ncbi:hypothetical protein T484DRAFT_1772147 [Baffinella frigidus]|nr:hypothetical protein T484DRAFT_1772147 [Cryptophyta sp. CCMP2293]
MRQDTSRPSKTLMVTLALSVAYPSPSAAFLSGAPPGTQGSLRRSGGMTALRMGGVDRREALRVLLAGGLSGAAVLQSPSPASAADNNDLFQAKFQQGMNKRTERLFACQTQNNCVSVSASKNPTQFGAPWDFTPVTNDPEKAGRFRVYGFLRAFFRELKVELRRRFWAKLAWASLKKAVAADSSLTLDEVDDVKHYLRATGTSKVPKDGVDDVEFLLVPSEKICTYRSAARKNVFVYPYQVAISDGGFQKERMAGIRERLGWVELNYVGSGVYSDGERLGWVELNYVGSGVYSDG